MSSSPDRKPYIDWARGLAVLVMIEAHALDAWTSAAARHGAAYRDLTIVGGFAAPLFLWLAGVSLALAAERRASRTTRSDAMAAGVRRGLEIFALAFVFRLQAFVVSPGGAPLMLLRVDILNVMGPALAAAVLLWGVAGTPVRAALLCATISVSIAMVTPLVRAAGWVEALPGIVQWYLRPAGDYTTFTLFPWAGFVFGGATAGVLLARAGTGDTERRMIAAFTAAGAALIVLGFYAASRPSLFATASFWTSSPTYFAIRCGVLLLVLGLLFTLRDAARRLPRPFDVLERLGRHSLFVYWIHVELVYGYATWMIHRRLPVWGTAVAYGIFCTFVYAAARGWEVLLARFRGEKPNPLHLWYLEGPVKNR